MSTERKTPGQVLWEANPSETSWEDLPAAAKAEKEAEARILLCHFIGEVRDEAAKVNPISPRLIPALGWGFYAVASRIEQPERASKEEP